MLFNCELSMAGQGAYEYGMGLLMAALVLRRSASLSPDRNRQLAAMLGSVWNRLLAAIREQMTRLRVAGLFYRDIAQVGKLKIYVFLVKKTSKFIHLNAARSRSK